MSSVEVAEEKESPVSYDKAFIDKLLVEMKTQFNTPQKSQSSADSDLVDVQEAMETEVNGEEGENLDPVAAELGK